MTLSKNLALRYCGEARLIFRDWLWLWAAYWKGAVIFGVDSPLTVIFMHLAPELLVK